MISQKLKVFYSAVFNFVGRDIKGAKSLDVENNIHHKFSYDLHNVSFFLILGFAALFFLDLLVLDAACTQYFMQSLGFNKFSIADLLSNKIRIFYLAAILVSSLLAVIAAFYFYIKNRDHIYKREILNIHVLNDTVSGVAQFFGGIPIWALFFIGGYVTVVKIPEVLGVADFAFVQAFLVLLIVKIAALMCGSSGSMLISLFSYRK